MVCALQLLYAKNDACLDDAIPLSFAEVLQEFAHFSTAQQLLL